VVFLNCINNLLHEKLGKRRRFFAYDQNDIISSFVILRPKAEGSHVLIFFMRFFAIAQNDRLGTHKGRRFFAYAQNDRFFCHPERSEGSHVLIFFTRFFAIAQNDVIGSFFVILRALARRISCFFKRDSSLTLRMTLLVGCFVILRPKAEGSHVLILF